MKFWSSGRWEGIRTLESLHFTRVPGVLLQPLGHPSKFKSRDYSENLKFCQIPFRRATCSAFKFKTWRLEFRRSVWNSIATLGIFLQRLEFRRAAWKFYRSAWNSTAPLSPAALRLPVERWFYLAAAILKFRLSLKFGLIARRGTKFKKRKQIF